MSSKNKNGCIIIPAYLPNNESVDSLRETFNGIPKLSCTIVVVAQINALTETRFHELIKDAGFPHIEIKKPIGKWPAFLKGLSLLSGKEEWVVILDADNAYQGKSIHDIIRPITEGKADHAIGKRLMAFLNAIDQMDNNTRLYIEIFFNTLVLIILDLIKNNDFNGFDIQCGLHAFSLKRISNLRNSQMPFYGGELKVFYESIKNEYKVAGVKVQQISSKPSSYNISAVLDGLFSLDFVKLANKKSFFDALEMTPLIFKDWLGDEIKFRETITQLVLKRIL